MAATGSFLSDAIDGQYISRVIFDYAKRIGREKDREALLAIIADMGRDLVGAERCTIWLLDSSTNQLVTRLAQGTETIRIDVGQGYAGRCVATGEIAMSNTVAEERGLANMVDARTGYHTFSVLAVPMRNSAGEIMGAFQALNKAGGFNASDADLLGLAAAYSASTLETQSLQMRAEEARRLEHEMQIAREVQQRLLPADRLAPVDGVEFAASCQPAAEVGGDYYDYLPLTDGCLTVLLGDISGKGIAAALMMASVQASLHSLVLQSAQEPHDIITRLNGIVYESSTRTRYSTLFFAHYDPGSGKMKTVNAGHSTPLLFRENGTVERLEADGPPVGLLSGLKFSQKEYTLTTGDTLVCYSDGISECHNEQGEIWPEEDFERALLDARGLPLERLVASVMDAASRFAGPAAQHDDMTIICLRAAERT